MSLIKLAARGDIMGKLVSTHKEKALDLLKTKFGPKKAMNASLDFMHHDMQKKITAMSTVNDILGK